MEVEAAKALTEALIGKELPTGRELIAAAAYGSLSALYLVAEEKQVTIEGSSPIKHLIALTAFYLVEDTTLKEAETHAGEIVKAAGYIVEGIDRHLGKKESNALKQYITK